jgi:Gpi18-like mannosyltransferase
LATLLFYRLVADEWGAAVAGRATWYLLIFPAAFFGSAIYTESVFLLGAIGALYFGRNGRWWLAALFGIMTAATRLVGIIVAPMLLLEWWYQRSKRDLPWQTLLAPLLVPLGTGSYMLYLWQRFGDPLAFVKAAAAWERVAQSPALTIRNLLQRPDEGWLTAVSSGHLPLNDWLDLLFILTFLVLGFVLLYQHRWSEGIFVWLGVMIAFSSGLLMSQRRYMWVLFPAFILLARWGKHVWVDRAITAVSLLLLALFTALFANGYWVG